MEDARVENDMDIDQCLVGKFSSLGTTDKDVLIGEFRKLLGFQLNVAGCEFFLDMTNWNLHAAIGAYYDFEMPTTKTPSMSFIRDITIGEGEAIPPDTEFIKTWRIQNTGNEKWPTGCTLRFVNGAKMGSPDWVAVADLGCGQTLDISVKMRSPVNGGLYQGQWRIYTRTMIPFGESIWVIISVEAGGLLGVTQQMSRFASNLGSPPKDVFNSPRDSNPFASAENPQGSNLAFAPTETKFRTVSNENDSKYVINHISQNFSGEHQDMEMTAEKDNFDSRRLTTTPELEALPVVVGRDEPSTSCWNTKSPTVMHEPSEDLAGTCHSLQIIEEESNMVADGNNNDDLKSPFLSSRSSYDLSARQASPFNSPSKLLELERSFTSPDAPSPIRPASRNLLVNFDEPPKAAQRLDFSGGS